MKRAIVILWLLTLSPATWADFAATYWPATNQPFFTNAMAWDVYSNVLWRCLSIGQTGAVVCVATESVQWVELRPTNLVFSNGVTLTLTSRVSHVTNAILTNAISGFVVTTPDGVKTGRITICDSLMEQIDDRLENAIPKFAEPFYATPYAWSFDDWFTNKPSGTWPNDFPSASKADLFKHSGIGLVSSNVTNWVVSIGGRPVTNYSGKARWTKRRDRPFWWRAYEVTITTTNTGTMVITPKPENFGSGFDQWYLDGAVMRYPRLPGVDWTPEPFISEFQEESFLDAPDPNPQWVFHAPTSGTFSIALENAYGKEWVSNTVADCTPPNITLSPGTQTADKAYLQYVPDNTCDGSLSFQWSASTNGRGSSLALLWTNNLTVYEGTKRWDSVLRPEALDERRTALTNLFLVPWNQWYWTNTMLCTNFSYYTNRTDLPSNIVYASDCTNKDWPPLDQIYSWPTNLAWWISCDQLRNGAITGNVIPSILPPICEGDLTNSLPPYFYYTGSGYLSVDCKFEGKHNWLASPDWSGCGDYWQTGDDFYQRDWYRSSTGWVGVAGQNATSVAVVTNIWTGALHRVHFYARRVRGNEHTPDQPYRLLETSAWTQDSTVSSTTRFDCAHMFPGETNPLHISVCTIGPSEVYACDGSGWTNGMFAVYDVYYQCGTSLIQITDTVDEVSSTALDQNCGEIPYTSYVTNRLIQYGYIYDTNAVAITNTYYVNLPYWHWLCDTNLPAIDHYAGTGFSDLCPTGKLYTNVVVNIYSNAPEGCWNTNMARSNVFITTTEYVAGSTNYMLVTELTNTVNPALLGIYTRDYAYPPPYGGSGMAWTKDGDKRVWCQSDAPPGMVYWEVWWNGTAYFQARGTDTAVPHNISGVNTGSAVRVQYMTTPSSTGTHYEPVFAYPPDPPIAGTNWEWETAVSGTWSTNELISIDAKVLVEWSYSPL